MNNKTKIQIECPFCGYKMPIFCDKTAESKGIHIACKGRNCKQFFEVKIVQGKQIK